MVAASTYFINVHAIPMFLMGIVTLALGFLVYRSNRQSPAHRHFLALCASIALWLDATSIGLCAVDAERALGWFKLDNVGVMYISIAFYAFSAEFLQLKRPRSIWLGYGLATLLAGAVLVREDLSQASIDFGGAISRSGARPVRHFSSFSSRTWPLRSPTISGPTVSPQRPLGGSRSISSPSLCHRLPGSIDFFPAFGYDLYPFGYIPIFLLMLPLPSLFYGIGSWMPPSSCLGAPSICRSSLLRSLSCSWATH